MDERVLFAQFHEALDIEPRPGASERLRIAMANQPVVVQTRPVLRMRWSKMGLRVAAAVMAAVLIIVAAALLLATHRGFIGSLPAGPNRPDKNVEAYQAMMNSNYNALTGYRSRNCTSVDDKECPAFVSEVAPIFTKWISDLNSFDTPAKFVVIDGQLRHHLEQSIKDFDAMLAYQKAKNRSGFRLALSRAIYERAWIEPAASAIEGWYPPVAGTYLDATNLALHHLYSCLDYSPGPAELSCNSLNSGEPCVGAAAQACDADVQNAGAQIQTLLIALLQNDAPAARTTDYTKLQTYLAQADTALLGIADGLLAGDSAKVDAAEASFGEAISLAHGAATAVLTS